GSGLVHAEISPEEFKRSGGPLEFLQLWLNLPARLKMTPPRYIGLQGNQIPALEIDDGKVIVHLVSGDFRDHTGAIDSLTGAMMSSVDMKPGARVVFDRLDGRDVFLYIVRGEVSVSDMPVDPETLVELSKDGDAVQITARTGAALLFGHANPIDEPVVSHGPFVMNTRAEIEQAIRDYQAGRFDAPAG
ncbi:MAG: pirin family protein, partial [Gammaproteobacteria bacterium]